MDVDDLRIVILVAPNYHKKAELCVKCFNLLGYGDSISLCSSTDTYGRINADVGFIDEETILSKEEFKNEFRKIEENYDIRGGWYYQQFLKLELHNVFDSNYAVWDSDTFPLKRIEFISDDGKYLFNRKTEHHVPYFNTMTRLLGTDLKIENESFISEYMVFDSKCVMDMIERIESIDDGKSWRENVLERIDGNEINAAGFSEYETYGTFMNTFYGDMFRNVHIETFRDWGERFTKLPTVEELVEEYADRYHTVTVEGCREG